MAASAVVREDQIRDVVRDSNIYLDISREFNRGHGSFRYGLNQAAVGIQNMSELYHSHGRVFSRSTKGAEDCTSVVAGMGFISSFDEIDNGLFFKTEKEDPFHGYYHKHGELIARFKKNLPVFDGFWHGDDLLRWTAAVDDFFEEIKPPEHVKCNIVCLKMQGRAYYWWKHLQQERNELGKREATSWAMMKNMLFNKFLHTTCSTKCLLQSYNSSKNESATESDVINSSSAGEGSVEEQPKEVPEGKPGTCLIKVPSENTVYDSEVVNGQHVCEVIQRTTNILGAENCMEENNDDDLEDNYDSETAAHSTKVTLESDVNKHNEEYEDEKESDQMLVEMGKWSCIMFHRSRMTWFVWMGVMFGNLMVTA